VFEPGQEFTRSTFITAEDARHAADLSDDIQPVHLDVDFAARTRFGRPIVPGALTIGRVAGLLGTGLIDLSTHYIVTQRFAAEFLRPVVVGDELLMCARVTEWDPESGRLAVDIEVRNQRRRRVLRGTANLLVFRVADAQTESNGNLHGADLAESS
jgi:acyl dehydratase